MIVPEFNKKAPALWHVLATQNSAAKTPGSKAVAGNCSASYPNLRLHPAAGVVVIALTLTNTVGTFKNSAISESR